LSTVHTNTLVGRSQIIRQFAKKAAKETNKINNEAFATIAVDEKVVKDALLASKSKMKETLDRFDKKLTTIRPGGVDASLIESIVVEVAPGKKITLSALGMVSAPTPLKLNVVLNDRDHAAAVERAISASGLNLQAKRLEDSGTVEIPVPKTTKEQRESRVKIASEEAEKIKVAIRGIRQDTQKKVKSMGLPEDDAKKSEKQLQTLADAAIEKIVESFDKKKKELLGNAGKD